MSEILNHKDIQSLVYTQDQIQSRVAELGAQITQDYAPLVEAGQDIVLVTLLRGAAFFSCDLSRHIKLPLILEYIQISSYGNSTKSSGTVTIQSDIKTDVAGKHVILIEDVLDSGTTLKFMTKNMKSRNPLSVEIATFLRKPDAPGAKLNCKYVGLDCPNDFVVGYGLDYAGRYRNVPEICILKPEVYS